VLWNEYDPTGKLPKSYLSNFIFANNQEAYDKLYTKIFRVPKHLPKGFSFGGVPEDFWSSEQVSLEYDTELSTEGNTSLKVCETGWFEIESSFLSTYEFEVFSNEISIDIYLPEGQSNPWWQGTFNLTLKVPAAGVWHSQLGQAELSGLETGSWHTLTFSINDQALEALKGDFANAQIIIQANINPSSLAILLCGLPVFKASCTAS
jgi:hypothetical protein